MLGEIIVTDAQLNSWLVFAGVVITAVLGYLGVTATLARQHAKATRNQVENSHTTNLREEQDDRHREAMDALADMRRHVDTRFDAQAADIRGVRRDIGRLADRDDNHEGRIHDLETTQPKEKP